MKNWGIFVIIILGVGAYQWYNSANRDASGEIVSAGTIDVFDLKVGDCFDDANADEISTLPAVPCTEPHDNEAYAAFNVSLPSYPGEEAMWQHAYEQCLDRFQGFVGRDYQSSELDIFTLYPTSESWAHDDREVVCAVYDMSLDKLTGSMQGSGR